MKAAKAPFEDPVHGAVHCLKDVPYGMISFARMNQQTPLFLVTGSSRGALSAKNALKEAFLLHGGKCFYCKQPISRAKLTVDHVEPESLGRNSHLQNLVIAHKACNLRKGHLPIEAFRLRAGREWLTALLQQVQDRLNRL